MIQRLKQTGQLQLSLLLFTMCIFCFALSLARIYITKSPMYIFLNWNLFLAFIPWALSTLVMVKSNWQKSKVMLILLLGTWILFFPNSPYILTDLFHLKKYSAMPVWFDVVLVLSFAWTGLLFGFISLFDIESLIAKRTSNFFTSALVTFLLFLSGFGIYLGRYLRFNTWDIIQKPFVLFAEIFDRFAHPLAHPRTWGMTILMGILLNVMFWSIRYLRNMRSVSI